MARVTRRGAIKTLGSVAAAAPAFHLKVEDPDETVSWLPPSGGSSGRGGARSDRRSRPPRGSGSPFGRRRIRALDRVSTRKGPTPTTATATRACVRPGRRRRATTRRRSRRSMRRLVRRTPAHLPARRSPCGAPSSKRRSPTRRSSACRRGPTGGHIATDLMGHYFDSSAAVGSLLPRGDRPRPVPRPGRLGEGTGATCQARATAVSRLAPRDDYVRIRRLHHRRRHLGRDARAEALGAEAGPGDHRRRSGREDLRLREPPQYRQRSLDYGENAWPGDFIDDQAGAGVISRTMAVGGSALHWGGVTNRFSEEDLTLKSRYGLAVDWPMTWEDLERHYCEAERRLGVSGEPGPLPEDKRSEPYPMPPMPLSYNLAVLKAWAEKSGIPFQGTPQAKNTQPYDGRSVCLRCNTCEICPTGARYSPDFTFKQLLAAKKITLHDQTLVRRLVASPDRKRIVVGARRVARAQRRRRSSTARRRSCSPRATPGRRTCCCCRTCANSSGARRQVHDRARVHRRADRARRDALSRA